MNNNVKSYAEMSQLLQDIRDETISEVEAILALQIGSEGQLSTLRAIMSLPEHIRQLPLAQLATVAKTLDGIGNGDFDGFGTPSSEKKSRADRLRDWNPQQTEAAEPGTTDPADDETRRVWVIVRARNNSGFLTGIRGPNINNAGQLCFPGGHPLIGQSSVKGAQMELLEETGIKLPLKAFQPLGWVEKKGVQHEFFLIEVDSAAHARELGLSDTEELGSFRFWQVSGLRQAVDRKVAHKSIKRYIDFRDYGAGTVLDAEEEGI